MQSILITGGAGFIGSNFVRAFMRRHPTTEIHVLDALTHAGNPDNFDPNLHNHPRFNLWQGDVCNPNVVGDLIERVDTVIHFAAESHVGRSVDDNAALFQADVIGTQVIANQILRRRTRIKRFVHISTSHVYGTALSEPRDETHPLDPSSPYGSAKCGADRLVYAYWRTYGIPAVIIRLFNQYGPYQHLDKCVPRFITSAMDGVPLTIHGDGSAARDWCYVSDTCEALIAALEVPLDAVLGEVINVGTGVAANVLTIAHKVLDLAGPNAASIEHTEQRPGQADPPISSTDKARRLLGWQARTCLDDGLAKTMDWYAANESWWRRLAWVKKVRLTLPTGKPANHSGRVPNHGRRDHRPVTTTTPSRPAAVDAWGTPSSGDLGSIQLSVVLPFRNERENLPELLERLRATLDRLRLSYELIFIDDGSTDDGAAYVRGQATADHRVKLLALSRNFGQHAAATAGIDVAQGAVLIWMDTDLQERPEDIPKLIAKHREGFDIVYARRKRRRQAPVRSAISHALLNLFKRLGGFSQSANLACMRLFTAQVAGSMRTARERNRWMTYLMDWMGYRHAEIELEIDPRRRGTTNYSTLRLARMAVNGLTSFSTAPLRISALCSVAAFVACGVGVAWILFRYFAFGIGVSGWATLVVLILGFHGLQFLVLAVLGEYVGLAYMEVKQRPLYLCRETINLDAPCTPIGVPGVAMQYVSVPQSIANTALQQPPRHITSADAAPAPESPAQTGPAPRRPV